MIQSDQILKIYGTDYKKMTRQLLNSAGLSECVRKNADRKNLPPGEMRIGIKPNLVSPTPAEYGATTHPEIVAGILEYLQENGFRSLLILEGSWVGDRTEDAFEYCGYQRLSEQYHVPLLDTKRYAGHSADCGDGVTLNITSALDQIDFLINVPVLKGHCQTRLSCALKNLKGLIPDTEKRRFHRLGLHQPIAYLQRAISADFIVTDHICGDPDMEDGGNPLLRNCVMASLDPVLTDSYAAYLLGYTADDIPYIRLSERLGIGSADLSRAEILCLSSAQPTLTPGASSVSKSSPGSGSSCSGSSSSDQPVPADKDWILTEDRECPRRQRLLEPSYPVEAVESCSACYSVLVSALRSLEEEGLLPRLSVPIGIGQGMRDKSGVLGVGSCTKQFDFSIPGCPPEEEDIYEGLKRFLLQKH